MRICSRRRPPCGVVVILLAVLAPGVALGGCGSKGMAGSASTTVTMASATATSSAVSTGARPPTTRPISAGGTSAGSTGETATSAGALASSTTAATTAPTGGTSTTTAHQTTTSAKATTTTAQAEVVLRVVGPSGTEGLSMADLKAMPSAEGWGGWKNQLGNITSPTRWKGVPVSAFVALAGGAGPVIVVASDGYQQTLSGAQLNGAVSMYDPATGDTITSSDGGLQVIVAYSQDGAPIGSDYGPLRIAFVSSGQDQVTDGSNWVKWVVELRVK